MAQPAVALQDQEPESHPQGQAARHASSVARRRLCFGLVVGAVGAGVSGCGFQLRGSANIPFETMALSGAENTPFAVELKRNILANRSVRIVDDPKLAQAILQVTNIAQERRILSLSGAGRVREFQLIYRVSFRVHDGKGRELMPTNEVLLRRDITFNDSQVLAKEQEEILLIRDMQSDAVQQVLRRLSTARLAAS